MTRLESTQTEGRAGERVGSPADAPLKEGGDREPEASPSPNVDSDGSGQLELLAGDDAQPDEAWGGSGDESDGSAPSSCDDEVAATATAQPGDEDEAAARLSDTESESESEAESEPDLDVSVDPEAERAAQRRAEEAEAAWLAAEEAKFAAAQEAAQQRPSIASLLAPRTPVRAPCASPRPRPATPSEAWLYAEAAERAWRIAEASGDPEHARACAVAAALAWERAEAVEQKPMTPIPAPAQAAPAQAAPARAAPARAAWTTAGGAKKPKKAKPAKPGKERREREKDAASRPLNPSDKAVVPFVLPPPARALSPSELEASGPPIQWQRRKVKARRQAKPAALETAAVAGRASATTPTAAAAAAAAAGGAAAAERSQGQGGKRKGRKRKAAARSWRTTLTGALGLLLLLAYASMVGVSFRGPVERAAAAPEPAPVGLQLLVLSPAADGDSTGSANVKWQLAGPWLEEPQTADPIPAVLNVLLDGVAVAEAVEYELPVGTPLDMSVDVEMTEGEHVLGVEVQVLPLPEGPLVKTERRFTFVPPVGPSATITAPANGVVLLTADTPLSFKTTGFALPGSGSVTLLLNGRAHPVEMEEGTVYLSDLPAGAHQAAVQLRDQAGKLLAQHVVEFTVRL